MVACHTCSEVPLSRSRNWINRNELQDCGEIMISDWNWRDTLVCALLLMLAGRAPAASQFSSIEAQMRGEVASRSVPSLAGAAIHDGRVIWLYATGWADVEAHRPAGPDTAYRIGSVSKSITATVAAVAAARNQINLSAPLPHYLPQYEAKPRLGSASLDDLLNMNAGLVQAVHYRGLTEDFSAQDMARFDMEYAVAPLASRTRYSYSNMGPELVADALAQAASTSYAAYARKELFAPLGMKNTAFSMRDLRPDTLAASYRSDGSLIAESYDTEPAAGAGGLASLRDLSRYVQLHLASNSAHLRLGSKAIERLHVARAGAYYSYGWGHVGSGDSALLISDGQVKGGQAVILLAPAKRSGVIVLTNVANDVVYALALKTMEQMIPGIEAEFERSSKTLNEAHERQIAGDYPADRDWNAHGRIFIGGVGRNLDVSAHQNSVVMHIDGDEERVGKILDRDDGFARWSVPCSNMFPACKAGTDADAKLFLSRNEGALSGMISVESRLGLFPYEVQLGPIDLQTR